jgi:hypothetical protein
MAKWNFFATNSSLIRELDTSGDDVNPQSQSFLTPTLDLQGAKIVFKEGGLYKTAILFTEIGTIDGVNPTDLQDAYDKIIALIPNSSGPSSFPNLTEVLTQGDRVWYQTADNYVFQGVDIATFILNNNNAGTPIFTIDGDLDNDFPIDCVLKFQAWLQPSQLEAINGALIYVQGNGGSLTTYNFNVGDYCELKKVNVNSWFLNVSNAISTPIPTKTSDLINDGDNGTSHFISLEDLPSTLTLYPTTAASGIGGYNKLVSSITDPDYNTTAVDVSTGAITGTDQLIAGLITDANQIVGNPGVFNMTTIGNIRKTSGSGQAEFFFRVYKRDAGGTETLILQSDNTQQITSAIYAEFNASGLWNDGVFISTDRIVIKFYGTKVGSGSAPTYDFQFGGTNPVRSIVPVPLTVIPVLSLDELSDVTITSVANNQLLAYTSATDLWQNKNLIDVLENFNTTQGIYFFEDFMGNLAANITNTTTGIITNVGNGQGTTRSTSTINNKTNQQGVVEALTSANATGTAGYYYASGVYKGSGSITIETYINYTNLSVLGERFFSLFGFYTGVNFTNPPNAIMIVYDEGGVVTPNAASPFFRCVTRIGGVTLTNTVTSIPVVALQWYRLKINISADGGTVTFFIDNTLVATHTTNIPLNATFLPVGCMLQKTSGTAARAMQTDYFMYKETFTTAR